jgi:hypothetical protein
MMSPIEADVDIFNPIVVPQPPGTMNEIKLIMHYISKHSCKSEILWYCGPWEENI